MASRAGLENKVGLALNEIGEIVGNEKGDMKGKVAVVSLLSNRIYKLESYAQNNRSHIIYSAQDKVEGLHRRPGIGNNVKTLSLA